MPTFIYKAKNQAGRFYRGVVEADDEQDVVSRLTSEGFQPLRIKAVEDTTIPLDQQVVMFDELETGND